MDRSFSLCEAEKLEKSQVPERRELSRMSFHAVPQPNATTAWDVRCKKKNVGIGLIFLWILVRQQYTLTPKLHDMIIILFELPHVSLSQNMLACSLRGPYVRKEIINAAPNKFVSLCH